MLAQKETERMNRLWITVVVLLCFGCGAEQSQEATPRWETDFSTFLKVLREAAQENRVVNTGDVDSDALNKIFLDKTVTWEGTLKYVHKGRPYFLESFVRVNKNTKLAAVMYYPDPTQVPQWEKIEKGSKVKYTGVIKTVHIDTIVSKEPFPFIDLKGVKPTKVTE
jgi:hypothetical protein